MLHTVSNYLLHFIHSVQDLVEALSARDTWFIPRKADQAAWERKPDGTYAGFEEIVPFGMLRISHRLVYRAFPNASYLHSKMTGAVWSQVFKTRLVFAST